MKVRLIEDEAGPVTNALKNYLASLGLEDTIQVAEPGEDAAGGMLELKIYKSSEETEVVCPQLGLHSKCKHESVNELIIASCGYKRVILKGLRVKDVHGNKSKPLINVFSSNTVKGTLPDAIEYTKVAPKTQKHFLLKQKIHFASEILSSLLQGTSIWFGCGERQFELLHDEGSYYIRFSPEPVPAALDFILDQTVNEALAGHMKIALRYPAFESFLTAKTENLVFNKTFYKKVRRSKREMDELLEFVEYAPKFQDVRDSCIQELKEFIHENYRYEFVRKHQYLEIYKAKVPKSKCKNSFRRLLPEG